MENKIRLMIGVGIICAAIFCGCGRNTARSQSAPPSTEWNDTAMRISPFTKVRYDRGKVIVTYNGSEYELSTINDLSVSDILDFCKSNYTDHWQRRFAEDLVPVLKDMGHPINSKSVSLSLIDPKTGQSIEVDTASMTPENRLAVHRAFEADHLADETPGGK